jgi:hypothetical protein
MHVFVVRNVVHYWEHRSALSVEVCEAMDMKILGKRNWINNTRTGFAFQLNPELGFRFREGRSYGIFPVGSLVKSNGHTWSHLGSCIGHHVASERWLSNKCQQFELR